MPGPGRIPGADQRVYRRGQVQLGHSYVGFRQHRLRALRRGSAPGQFHRGPGRAVAGRLAIAAILVCMVLGSISRIRSGRMPQPWPSSWCRAWPPPDPAGPFRPASSPLPVPRPSLFLRPSPSSCIACSCRRPQCRPCAAGLIPGLLAGLALIAPASGPCRSGVDSDCPTQAVGAGAWFGLQRGCVGVFRRRILGGIRSGYFTSHRSADRGGGCRSVRRERSAPCACAMCTICWWRSAEVSAVVMLIIALSSVFAWAGNTLGASRPWAQP